MKFFFDTEFMALDARVELLSIGIVREDGQEFYAVNTDADLTHADDFVKQHVLPGLNTIPTGSVSRRRRRSVEMVRGGLRQLGQAVDEFLPPLPDGERHEAWAYYADYDWVAFCSMWGRMVDLPSRFPWLCRDVMQLALDAGLDRSVLPEDDKDEHHALVDARWTKRAYDQLARRLGR